MINEERRISERISDKSYLIVRGAGSQGGAFTETTQVNDVSSNGISFLLRNPVEISSILELSIGELEEEARRFTPTYSVQARVMSCISTGKTMVLFRVGAKFEGEVHPLENVFDLELFSQQLQEAINQDEKQR